MSAISKFNIFIELDKKYVINISKIRLFYLTNHCLICVTIDDSVFQFKIRDKRIKYLHSFCENEAIIKFDCSYAPFATRLQYIALTESGRVYYWSNTSLFGAIDVVSFEPKLINKENCFVTDICCGGQHSLLLTRDGEVYAFGDNGFGQCCADGKVGSSGTPIRVEIPKVCAISCGYGHSIALTPSGVVYGWGDNSRSQLGIASESVNWFSGKLQEFGFTDDAKQFKPIKLNVTKIMQIACGPYHTLMLSSDGNIYFCGQIDDCLLARIPIKVNFSETKFIKIAATVHSDLCAALSRNKQCFIFGKSGNKAKKVTAESFQSTEFTTIEDTYAFYEQITYKSVQVESCNNEMFKTLPFHSLNTQINTRLPSLMSSLDMNTSDTNKLNDYECHTVSLTRDESGFGLGLYSGSKNGTNIMIGSILTDGVAHRNGVLCVGDHIISINGRSVTGLTHHFVVQLLSQTDTCVVSIKIKRKRYLTFV